jgi:1-aminocyclopropane-1-carboxylate deaminase/D-cysteine desulfhydrase-like pyridoxal-dependent ACC family enzyme
MDGSLQGGHVRVYQEIITLATQTTSDTIVVAYPSKGEMFLFGVLLTTVTLGASTIAIGITGTTGKYRAAATFTAVDTPTLFGVTTGASVKLTADETVFITIATASLPGAGTLVVQLHYAQT